MGQRRKEATSEDDASITMRRAPCVFFNVSALFFNVDVVTER